MNNAKNNRTYPRKNLAQDRLEKLREELKLKRKIHEKLEKFSDEEPFSKLASSPVNVFIDKFLPDAKHIKTRDIKHGAEAKRSADRKLDKLEITRKGNQQLKSPQKRCYDLIHLSPGDSNKRRRARKKLETPPSGAEYPSPSFSAPNTSNDSKIKFSSPKNRRKNKGGIGPQRLEKARKSLLENSSKNEKSEYQTGKAAIRTTNEMSAKLSNRTSRDVKTQQSTETKSPKSNTKGSVSVLPKPAPTKRQLSETHSVERESVSTPVKIPSSASPRIETESQLTKAKESTFTFTVPSAPTVNTCAHFISSEYDMDVDMDVDLDSPFSSTTESSNSPTKISERWPEKIEAEVSSIMSEIERIRDDHAYLARHESYISDDIDMNLSVPSGDLLIVVDTNIFLSHLRFLHRLLKSSVSDYKAHVLVVPWVVIQEIDFAMKKKNDRLASQARLANHFIFECLKKEMSNFFGQSFKDFKACYKNAGSVDDFLLQYCLKLISMRNNVVFLSDDKNLCSKCMFSHVPAYTRDHFEKTFDIKLL